MTPKLQLIGVKKKLRGRQVLDGVDLDVAPGKSLVVIGGSGVGKSVTLKCALGLMIPDDGKVLVDGEDVTRLSQSQRERVMRKFGMLFQGGALFDSLTVWENVAFRLIYADGVSRKEARERAVETMRKVRLAPEFADVERARALFRALEEKTKLLDLLDRVQRAKEMQIFIGSESDFSSAGEVSVIASPYGTDNQMLGAVGIIGPTRMNYQRVIPLVNFTAQVLSRVVREP